MRQSQHRVPSSFAISHRDFKLLCRAVGVRPPLELSHSLVQFRATAADDVSTAVLHVVNSHTGHNEFTHPAPRIGKGAALPTGLRLFEFAPPENSEITITPATGRVLPGQVQGDLCQGATSPQKYILHK